VDATNALDSYQGEPTLVAGGGLLVGGQNDFFPYRCDGTVACWPSATVSVDRGKIWVRTKLPITWERHAYCCGSDPSLAYDGNRFYAGSATVHGGDDHGDESEGSGSVHPYYTRHVDPDSGGTDGGYENYGSRVTQVP
jgi:hypothetical protein